MNELKNSSGFRSSSVTCLISGLQLSLTNNKQMTVFFHLELYWISTDTTVVSESLLLWRIGSIFFSYFVCVCSALCDVNTQRGVTPSPPAVRGQQLPTETTPSSGDQHWLEKVWILLQVQISGWRWVPRCSNSLSLSPWSHSQLTCPGSSTWMSKQRSRRLFPYTNSVQKGK